MVNTYWAERSSKHYDEPLAKILRNQNYMWIL